MNCLLLIIVLKLVSFSSHKEGDSSNTLNIFKQLKELESHSSDINLRDTLLALLNKHCEKDSFEYSYYYDELQHQLSYIKIGGFLKSDLKTALLIYTPTDSTINAELYSIIGSDAKLLDKKLNLDARWLSFYAKYEDFNFDGIKDIYINVDASNGLGLSRGHLLTINTRGEIHLQAEARGIADMVPISFDKTVRAKEAFYCQDGLSTCNLVYKWINKKLILIDKSCPCN